MCGYAASCTPAELQHREEEEEEELMSSQIQHHLNQASSDMDQLHAHMHMNMDDEAVVYDEALDMPQHPVVVDGLLDPHNASSFPTSSSSSSLSLRSASLSCSPSSSAHILGGGAPAATAAAACGQYPEVSSHVVPLPPAVPYDNQQYANAHAHAPAPAKRGAFKSYARHLGPRRQAPKPGACGQRMFKTALSVLSKMDMAAKYSQQQYYYQQQEAAEAPLPPPPTVNQLQHMISERKRREKLNDSFHALKTVLPPGAKKDKTSILVRAREYIRSLESKAFELEEKNKSLETRLAQRGNGGAAGDSGDDEKVQIEITRAAKEELPVEPRDLCTLKIVVRSRCNMTDVVLRTLQCLKEKVGDDVNLVSMNTSTGGSAGPSQNCSSPQAVLTMQIKSPGANWDEQPVKDAVAKVVADALMLPSAETTTTAPDQRQ
ncbi:hypothetical protein EJB05_31010, partial [Eragrostis curvula]